MKKIKILLAAISAAFLFSACENLHDPDYYYYDNQAPIAPEGLVVYNGDNQVDISWFHNPESDVAGYNVYFAYTYDGRYELIGSTADNYFIDYGANNGNKYYYAVAAYDYNGNESELSYDVAYATPRPEGYNQAIFDYLKFPNNSGYSFDNYSVVPFDDLEADVFFENYQGTFYLNVWDDTDIQDVGSTNDIYDIPYAPTSGWSPDKYVQARIGHTYVIWTWDNHFAKIRVHNITRDRVVFDWAYQLVEGDTQLKPKSNGEFRKNITSKNERIIKRSELE